MIRNQIISALAKASGVKAEDIGLEFPENEEFGDYSSNVALQGNRPEVKGKNPRQIADEIVEKLKRDGDLSEIADKVEIAGPGFINFWLNKNQLLGELKRIHKDKERFGISDLYKGQKIVIEYAHPNTHKAFHIGHLRNITTGEALCRLLEAVGASVVRVNYQGDVGLHIAKAIWGILKLGFSDPTDTRERATELGKAYAEGAKAYEADEKAKAEIEALNSKIYDRSDPEINKLYDETRKWSLEYFDIVYKRVNTKFDRLYFESEVAEGGKSIALDALKKGILEKSEGAVIFPGTKYGLHDRVFISSKGVPTYEAKDLGLAKLQFEEFNPDHLIHIVGPEQSGYFKVLFKALEFIMPKVYKREVHIPYGWVRLKEGKMSSRTGDVVLGEMLLDEAKGTIKSSFDTKEETAEQIAVGAVKYSFLKTGLNQDIAFDLKESISLEGNSGPYLQYTIARANSVLAKVHPEGDFFKISLNGINQDEESILRYLTRMPEIIIMSANSYSPNLLCNYLYELASKYNSFYNSNRIIGSDNEEFRLALTFGVGQILKNGLKILGMDTPERM